MSHDQKPARVRVVNATRPPSAPGIRAGSAGGAGAVVGSDADGGTAASAKGGGGRGSLLIGGLFVIAAGIGGTCAALFLP